MSRPAFTIVELLVAMAVFLLMCVVVVGILGNTTRVASLSSERLNAAAAIRDAFQRMDQDLSMALVRPEFPDRVEKRSGNDRLVFYSAVDAYTGLRGISAVAYEVRDGRLLRGVSGYDWVEGTSREPIWSAGLSLADLQEEPRIFPEDRGGVGNDSPDVSGDENFEMLSPGIFRFEYLFLLRDGSLSTMPVRRLPGLQHNLSATQSPDSEADATSGYAPGSRWYRPGSAEGASRTFLCMDATPGHAVWRRLGWEDVRGIIVGVAAIDPDLRNRFDLGSDEMNLLAGAFGDAEENRDLMEVWSGWETRLQETGLPQPVRNAIQIRQHYFPIRN